MPSQGNNRRRTDGDNATGSRNTPARHSGAPGHRHSSAAPAPAQAQAQAQTGNPIAYHGDTVTSQNESFMPGNAMSPLSSHPFNTHYQGPSPVAVAHRYEPIPALTNDAPTPHLHHEGEPYVDREHNSGPSNHMELTTRISALEQALEDLLKNGSKVDQKDFREVLDRLRDRLDEVEGRVQLHDMNIPQIANPLSVRMQLVEFQQNQIPSQIDNRARAIINQYFILPSPEEPAVDLRGYSDLTEGLVEAINEIKGRLQALEGQGYHRLHDRVSALETDAADTKEKHVNYKEENANEENKRPIAEINRRGAGNDTPFDTPFDEAHRPLNQVSGLQKRDLSRESQARQSQPKRAKSTGDMDVEASTLTPRATPSLAMPISDNGPLPSTQRETPTPSVAFAHRESQLEEPHFVVTSSPLAAPMTGPVRTGRTAGPALLAPTTTQPTTKSKSFFDFLKAMDCRSSKDMLCLKQHVHGPYSHEFEIGTIDRDTNTWGRERDTLFLKIGGLMRNQLLPCPRHEVTNLHNQKPPNADIERASALGYLQCVQGEGDETPEGQKWPDFLVCLGEVFVRTSPHGVNSGGKAIKIVSTNFFVLMSVESPAKSLWLAYRYEQYTAPPKLTNDDEKEEDNDGDDDDDDDDDMPLARTRRRRSTPVIRNATNVAASQLKSYKVNKPGASTRLLATMAAFDFAQLLENIDMWESHTRPMLNQEAFNAIFPQSAARRSSGVAINPLIMGMHNPVFTVPVLSDLEDRMDEGWPTRPGSDELGEEPREEDSDS